ncbi:MAG: hypothetical protein WKF96_02915 [Solirubrobacteraceae bacterium]
MATCEVKEFCSSRITNQLLKADNLCAVIEDEHKSTRASIKKAAEQMRATYLPAVVVLANANRLDVDIGDSAVPEILYGDTTLRFDEGRSYECVSGLNGALTSGRSSTASQIISAVVILTWVSDAHARYFRALQRQIHGLRRPVDPYLLTELSGAVQAADKCGFENQTGMISATTWVSLAATDGDALPMPSRLFDGPNDARWEIDRGTRRYARV